MNKQDIMEKLNEIFQDVFDDEELTVSEETTAKDVDGWDSLMQIMLVVSIEKTFGIKFAMNEITNLKNVGEMAERIAAKL